MAFVKRAGTLIFASTVLIWALSTYPGDHTARYELQTQLEQLKSNLEADSSPPAGYAETQESYNELSSQLLEESYIGRAGHAIEPLVKPLGWDWRIGVGVLASFPAREVVIATLGIIYSLGGDVDEENSDLTSAIQQAQWPDGTPVYTIPVGLSIMVFFALCAQCVSTLAIIRRETNSWKWPAFSFAYMTILAYVVAFATFQISDQFL